MSIEMRDDEDDTITRPSRGDPTGALVRHRKGAPKASTEDARKRMRATRRAGTAAELALRAELDGLGLIYEVDRPALPGQRRRPDMVFPSARVAIYVDGCFWHGCPVHGTTPKSNREWWEAKLGANKRRDADAERELCDAGWQVLRFWEHVSPREAARMVAEAIERCEQVPDSGTTVVE